MEQLTFILEVTGLNPDGEQIFSSSKIVTFARSQTEVSQLSCEFNPSLSPTLFQFLDHFRAHFFSDYICLSFCFDTYSFFYPLSKQSHAGPGTDRILCSYTGNTDAQITLTMTATTYRAIA